MKRHIIQDAQGKRHIIEVADAPPTTMEKFGNNLAGVGEGVVNAVTGTAGAAAGGLHGLLALAQGEGVDAAAKNVEDTSGAMTYAPTSETGQQTSKLLALPMTLAGDAGKYVGGGIGQAVGGDQGRIAGESIGEAGNQMALTLMGGAGVLGKNKARVLKNTEKARDAAAAIEAPGVAPVSKMGLFKELAADVGPRIAKSYIGHILAGPIGAVAGAMLGKPAKYAGRTAGYFLGRKGVDAARGLARDPVESIPQGPAPAGLRQQIQEARSQAAGAEAAGPVPRPPVQNVSPSAIEAELAAYSENIPRAAPGASLSLPTKPKLTLAEVRRLQAEAAALRGK